MGGQWDVTWVVAESLFPISLYLIALCIIFVVHGWAWMRWSGAWIREVTWDEAEQGA